MCVDGATVAFAIQERQTAGMIDMGVAEDHRIQGLYVEREGLPVAPVALVATLQQAAIEQQLLRADLDQVTGAGDFPRGAITVQLHIHILFSWVRSGQAQRTTRLSEAYINMNKDVKPFVFA
jgi:hypothetical protein